MEVRGLKISRKKTEYLSFCNESEGEVMQGESLKRADNFKYLGSILARNGDLDAEIGHRVQTEWRNWRRVSGVLHNKRINVRAKGKLYKAVVRPAMMYGAEMWGMKKAQEKRLDMAEMRILRWTYGVTKLD